MSNSVLTKVWEMPGLEGTELIVMLALADFADDAGSCFPSVAKVAERARKSDRAVRTVLRNLEAKGYIDCPDKSGGRGRANHYTISLNPEAQTSENTAEEQKAEKAENTEAQTSGIKGGKGGSFEQKAEAQTSAEPSIRTIKERDTKVSPKKVSPASVLSPLLGSDLAAALIEHRQRLRKPMTERAAGLLLRKLERCRDPCAGAEMMIERGWQGFEVEWFEQAARGNGKGTANDRTDRIFRMADGLDKRAAAERQVDRGQDAQSSLPLLPADDTGGDRRIGGSGLDRSPRRSAAAGD